jgi:hypothetical protein
VDCDNGTVTDTSTGLIWLRDVDCLEGSDFGGANDAASQLADGECDLTDGSRPGDWRLPTRQEWETVIEQAVANDCDLPYFPDRFGLGCCGVDDCAFIGVGTGLHWSSTSNASSPLAAWAADLGGGLVVSDLPKSATDVRIWPIRGGHGLQEVGARQASLRISQLDSPQVSAELTTSSQGTCSLSGVLCQSTSDCAVNEVCVSPQVCVLLVEQWTATIEATAVEVTMNDVVITYDWVNPILDTLPGLTGPYVMGLGGVAIPAGGTNAVRFIPIPSDVLNQSYYGATLEGATANLTLLFRGVTLDGTEVTLMASATLVIDICT